MRTPGRITVVLSLIFMAAALLILAVRIMDRPPRQDTSNPPHQRNLEIKQHMLELVNQVRAQSGLTPVQMGGNNAAQLHAQDAADGCSGGHWDRHGLKPYMRHTLAGGHQPNRENWYNTTSCGNQSLWKMGEEPRNLVQEAIEWLMESPGHRATILDPQATHMSAGIAWGPETFNVVQHFHSQHAIPDGIPALQNGLLSIQGTTLNIPRFRGRHDLAAIITYDPPPKPIGENLVARTSCYGQGEMAAIITLPQPDRETGQSRNNLNRTVMVPDNPCPDPYRMDPNLPAARTTTEIDRLAQDAWNQTEIGAPRPLTIMELPAQVWTAQDREFRIEARVDRLLKERGPGVYTLQLHLAGPQGTTPLIQHSFFYQVEPPGNYAKTEKGR